jgi:peptidoglycan hydrolase CwlO-like protein
MKLKEEIASTRYHIMRLRARGLSTKPQNHLHDEVKSLQNLCTSAVKQRDDLVRMLDKAEANLKFLEGKLREIRSRGEA